MDMLRTWIGILIPVAIHNMLDVQVQTYKFAGLGQRLDMSCDGDGDEVVPTLVFADRAELNLTFRFSMQNNWNSFEKLGDDEPTVLDPDILLDSKTLLLMSLLERRKPWLLTFLPDLQPAEEVVVGVLQALHRVLQRLTSHFLEPIQFGL